MKKPILIVLALTTFALAGVIEYQDDDRTQWLTFENCNPDSIAQVIVGFSLDLDSGYAESYHALSDSIDFSGYFVGNPDRDENGYAIPGHYQGEYWTYVKSATWAGDTIAAIDTNHVAWDYIIPGGCAGVFHID